MLCGIGRFSVLSLIAPSFWNWSVSVAMAAKSKPLILPKPDHAGRMPLEEALRTRRSVRSFGDGPVPLQDLSQLLWAAQGTTDPTGLRAAPSAGALYPLVVYAVAGNVASLPAGLYRYDPSAHALSLVQAGDRRAELSGAALRQDWIGGAAVSLVVAALFRRTTAKYGDRGVRYVHMEAGHVAQNIYLQATALHLGTTVVGAFQDDRLNAVLGLPADEDPLCILPVGRPAAAGR